MVLINEITSGPYHWQKYKNGDQFVAQIATNILSKRHQENSFKDG